MTAPCKDSLRAVLSALASTILMTGALAVETDTVSRASAMVARLPASVNALPPAKAAGFVNFSFDQVDVTSFVELVGEITGRKFVVGEGVAGPRGRVVGRPDTGNAAAGQVG